MQLLSDERKPEAQNLLFRPKQERKAVVFQQSGKGIYIHECLIL